MSRATRARLWSYTGVALFVVPLILAVAADIRGPRALHGLLMLGSIVCLCRGYALADDFWGKWEHEEWVTPLSLRQGIQLDLHEPRDPQKSYRAVARAAEDLRKQVEAAKAETAAMGGKPRARGYE